VDRVAYRRQRAVLLTAQALSLEDSDRTQASTLALEAVKLAPSFVPAAALAGRVLTEMGEPRKAARIIETAWRANPHPDLAEAYATLGRGGMHRTARLIRGDNTEQSASQVCLRADTCWQTLAALSNPERTAAVCAEAADRAVAWKTGTSSGNRDAWCAAVTPAVTVVVWMGNLDGSGSAHLIGTKSAAPLALELAAERTEVRS